jgi:hypothetical protein
VSSMLRSRVSILWVCVPIRSQATKLARRVIGALLTQPCPQSADGFRGEVWLPVDMDGMLVALWPQSVHPLRPSLSSLDGPLSAGGEELCALTSPWSWSF